MEQKTDNELIRLYRNGDVGSFMALVERYQARVYGYIFSLLKDKEMANKIFQDTFYKVINTIKNDQYDYERKFCPWLLSVAHSLIFEYFKNKRR